MANVENLYRQQQQFSNPENNVHNVNVVEQPIRESPPPLIRMHPSRSSSPQRCYSAENHQKSPNHLGYSSERSMASPPYDNNSRSPSKFEFACEDSEEPRQIPSFMFFQRELCASTSPVHPCNSSSFRAFPFPPSQPLQSLSALNASLEPSINPLKFGTHLEEFHFRNSKSWLQSSLIGSQLGEISQSTALLLQHHQQQQQLQVAHRHPVRPLPLNMIRSRHPSASTFNPTFWNHFLPFKPFNLGLHSQNSSEPLLERYHGIENQTRFPTTEIFHPS